jgi:glycolate oxidase
LRKEVALGGAISGEHGIGLAKTPFLRLQHSPA